MTYPAFYCSSKSFSPEKRGWASPAHWSDSTAPVDVFDLHGHSQVRLPQKVLHLVSWVMEATVQEALVPGYRSSFSGAASLRGLGHCSSETRRPGVLKSARLPIPGPLGAAWAPVPRLEWLCVIFPTIHRGADGGALEFSSSLPFRGKNGTIL